MNTNELKVLKQAILNEMEGYEFYKLASKSSDNNEISNMFMNIANEELKHVEWLKSLFENMKSNKGDAITLSEIKDIDVPSPDIYKWSKVSDKNPNLSVTVFSIGMQMEKDSVAFYKAAHDNTKNELARALYQKLIVWENNHLETFSEEYDVLKRQWWSNQGFEPF